MARKYGYIPDKHDKSKDPNSRALFGAGATALPEATLEPQVSLYPYRYQGDTSSCVAFTLARALHVRAAKAGAPIDYPSEQGIYAWARKQAGQPLTDDGCMPSAAVMGMTEWGVARLAEWPFDPEAINDDPTLLQQELASCYKVSGYHRLAGAGMDAVAEAKVAISNGYPVAVGIAVDQAFEDYNGKTNITAPTGDSLGNHYVLLVGYTRTGLLRGMNWWQDWGDGTGPMFWATPDWLAASEMDKYVITGETLHGAHPHGGQ